MKNIHNMQPFLWEKALLEMENLKKKIQITYNTILRDYQDFFFLVYALPDF